MVLQPIDLTDDTIASRVVDIQRAAYRIEAELIGFEGIPQLHETVDDLRRLDLHWLGSWVNGQLVAILAWTLTDGNCGIDRLAVCPQSFRQGHGRALVEFLADHRVVSVSTGTANTPARNLYASLGFVPVGVREIAPGITVTELCRLK